jgi:hypothetical protein
MDTCERKEGRKEGRKAEKQEKEIFVIGRVGGKCESLRIRIAAARTYVNRIKVDIENMLGPNTVTPTTVRSTDRPGSDLYFMFL